VARQPRGLRLLAPVNHVRAGLDDTVTAAFEAALAALREAGARSTSVRSRVRTAARAARETEYLGAEAYWWHRTMLAKDEARYDVEIARRIHGGEAITAAEYIDLLRGRTAYIDAFTLETDPLRTTRCSGRRSDRTARHCNAHRRRGSVRPDNALVLRNTSAVNVA